MKLGDLIKKTDCHLVRGSLLTEVRALEYHSKNIKQDSAFFAIDGYEHSGMDYIDEAIENGASVIVLDRLCCIKRFGESELKDAFREQFEKISENTSVLLTEDIRKTLAYMSCEFYNNPSEELQVIGVTGTKGKTSVTFMIRHILEKAGIKTGIIGTVIKGYEGNFKKADSTTPQSPEIQQLMREMKDNGCRALVMEVSSQGLKHSRVEGIRFNLGVFTNVSPDHIGGGEHKDFSEYLECKSKLFDMCSRAVVNGDDEILMQIAEKKENPKQKIIYGSKDEHDLCFSDVELLKKNGNLGARYMIHGKAPLVPSKYCESVIELWLPGRFNIENSLAAIGAARALGVPFDIIKEALKEISIPGRAEIIDIDKNFTVMVDYAHNGAALENLLEALREYEPKRLMVVMGCGGNRDRNRRFQMGKAAFELADYIIITSDNPRDENPEKIIRDITSVMDFCDKTILAITDREKAIKRAVLEGRKGDMIVIAGKGHETYQIIGDKAIDFDDKDVVLSCGKEER